MKVETHFFDLVLLLRTFQFSLSHNFCVSHAQHCGGGGVLKISVVSPTETQTLCRPTLSVRESHCHTPLCRCIIATGPVGRIQRHVSHDSVVFDPTGQTPRLCNLPSKSYSNNINVPYTGGNDLVNESGKPFNGIPIKF